MKLHKLLFLVTVSKCSPCSENDETYYSYRAQLHLLHHSTLWPRPHTSRIPGQRPLPVAPSRPTSVPSLPALPPPPPSQHPPAHLSPSLKSLWVVNSLQRHVYHAPPHPWFGHLEFYERHYASWQHLFQSCTHLRQLDRKYSCGYMWLCMPKLGICFLTLL